MSHDREFLDNVVTSTIVFEENGHIQEYVGGYTDWLRRGHALAETDNPFATTSSVQAAAERRTPKKPNKLSYMDQRELDHLPGEIEALETSIADLQQVMSQADFYSQEHGIVQSRLQELADAQALLEQRIERWAELETLQSDLRSP